ncbi:MAG: TlpA disulfide reductase family protein, partial [Planctomycetota bacterium]
ARTDVARRAREQARQLREARANQNRRAEGVARFNMMNMFTNAFNKDAQAVVNYPVALYLASGEIIPCQSIGIEENDIVFQAKMTEQTRIPRSEILAIRLTAGSYEPVLETTIRERIMTVPRVNKKDPPTHLLVAVNGDVLRCRLIRMDQSYVYAESRLEPLRLSRDLVGQVIWLSSPEESKERTTTNRDLVNGKLDFLAIQKSGSRVGLVPTAVTTETIVGTHPHLGSSSVAWEDISLLSFNGYLTESIRSKPYSKWKLADAPEPTIPDGGPGGDSGKGSKLVGKPAPNFKLELLNGDTFELQENRGKVVVLDFWATWCGPCMQAMPVIEETVQAFDSDNVRLIAVNLQESSEEIERTLRRLGIAPEVALDIDGVAAILYEANAIPQTVVIDENGVVTRVYVGSGGDLGTQLKAAIDECLSAETAASP